MPAPETQPRSSKRAPRSAPPSSQVPSSSPRSSKRAPVDLEALLPSLLARVEDRGSLSKADLRDQGIPSAQQKEALELLKKRGYEVTGTTARIPLLRQLQTLLAQRQVIPAEPSKLKPLLTGVKPTELTAAIRRLLADQEAILVFRGKKRLYLARPGAKQALGKAQVKELLARASELVALCKEALIQKPAPAHLFGYDVIEQIEALRQISSPEASPTGQASSPASLQPTEAVLEALRRASGPSKELASVPAAVAALETTFPRSTLHETLLDLDRSGLIELQAEAGLGRFSREDLERCPPGPRGFSLVWARMKEEKK
jgi:hypothetical protein